MQKCRIGNAVAESLPDEERSGSASTGRHRHEKPQLVHHLSHHLLCSFLSHLLFFASMCGLLLLLLDHLSRTSFTIFLLDASPTSPLDEPKKTSSAILFATCLPRLFVLTSSICVMDQVVRFVSSSV